MNIPGWFGDEAATDVSAVVSEAFRLTPGTVQAWSWGDLVFIKGHPSAVAFMRRTLDIFSNPISPARPLLEAIFTLRPPLPPVTASQETLLEYWWMKTAGKSP